MSKITFFIDVDNTLLNNDLIKEQLKRSLITVLGETEANHFWQHHDEFRAYQKLVDFPAITRLYCSEQHHNTCELVVGNIFTHIQFTQALYPQAIETLRHLRTIGTVSIFSEGDMVYQKMKIEKSGIAAAADNTLLFTHKLDHLVKILHQYQDTQLVFIDDRDDKLQKIKQQYPTVQTVVVCQGHYASNHCLIQHTADRVLGAIDDALQFTSATFSNIMPTKSIA